MRYLALLVMLAGCSTITNGTTQMIDVNTDPVGADCTLTRHNEQIGLVSNTPAFIQVDKTKYDILFTCRKAGYQNASYFNKSDIAGMTVGNAIFGGLIGWGIDSATGSDNKYDSSVFIKLQKK